MAHRFPDIRSYGCAFRFAIEAEQATADLAEAAAARTPEAAWRKRLWALAKSHRERAASLTVVPQKVNEMILAPITALEAGDYLGSLDAEPEDDWPAAAEQLIAAEEDAARYHQDFAATAEEVLAANARAFRTAAGQDREAAEEVRQMWRLTCLTLAFGAECRAEGR